MDEPFKTALMSKVETDVCTVINRILDGVVSPCDLYVGQGNIPVVRAVARNVTFHILHNKYGLSYADIAKRAKMNKESIMRCIRKVQYMTELDPLYMKIMEAM